MKKIYFCVSQMIMVQNLLNETKSNFFARVISRQVIIRIDDFVDLTRRYNNQHIINHSLKRELKRKLNELNNTFENILKLQRHKFGAHFQDLEFFERINSWSDITKENIDIFVNKILEIYNLLERENGFQEIIKENLKVSIGDIKSINKILKEKDIESVPHFGMDILSITRSNSSSVIPCHPIQDKILVLNTIELMLDFEIALYDALNNKEYKSLLKTLIINDVISFIDNLITRENSKYVALDEIIDLQITPWKRHKFSLEQPNTFFPLKVKKYDFQPDKDIKESKRILNNFLKIFNRETLNSIRDVRNKMGSHIDREDSFEDLMILFDEVSVEKINFIYLDFYNLFLKTCKPVNYLNMFIMPKSKMRGITSISPQPEKMFFSELEVETEFKSDDINDRKVYEENINALLNKSKEEEDIKFYFRSALSDSKIIKKIIFEDKELELTKCQLFCMDRLEKSTIVEEKRAILFLLKESSHWKSNGTYILVKTYRNNLKSLNYEYLNYFGETTQEHSTSVLNILVNNLKYTNDFNIIYHVLLSLLKLDVKTSNRGTITSTLVREQVSENRYSKIIKQTIHDLTPLYRIVLSLVFTSEMMFTSYFAVYRERYKILYLDYFQYIFLASLKEIKLDKKITKKDFKLLKIYFEKNNLTDIIFFLADKKIAELLYGVIPNSLKLNYNENTIFVKHLAYANYKLGNINEAVEIYEELVKQNPDILEYRLEMLNYYFEQKNIRSIKKLIEYIESVFHLTEQQKVKIQEIEKQI